MSIKIIKTFLFLFLLLTPCAVFAASTHHFISLKGAHKFHPGDNTQWASLDYDDSQWQKVDVPGSWQSQGVKPENGMGWYRIRFTVPKEFKDTQLAIAPGKIGNADEVFLNGVKIGGEGGMMANGFVEATNVNRLYKIHGNLLRFDDENLLAVRITSLYLEGGIFDKNPVIGDYRDLLVEKVKRDFAVKGLEIFIFPFLFIFFLSSLLFYAMVRENEYLYFGLSVLIYGVLVFFESLIFYETGLKTPLIEQIIAVLLGLLPLALLLFGISVFRVEFSRPLKFIVLFSLFLSPVLLFSTYSYRVFHLLYLLWILQILLISSAGLYIVAEAYLRKLPESGPILLGIIGLFIGALIESMVAFDVEPFGYYASVDYPMLLFLILVMYAMVARFARIRNQLKQLSIKILSAHEEERKRLARELHDGLGQNLLAVKFNLQRINQEIKNNLVGGVINEISGSINELRDISSGLRPEFLDETGLAPAIKLYCKRFSQKTNIDAKVSADIKPRPAPVIEENLFRIFQEALSNIIKHAEAANVKISLYENGQFLIMEIEDDGKGFDLFDPSNRGAGIGLSTMEERVRLIDGILNIKSKKGEGTNIRIEVSAK